MSHPQTRPATGRVLPVWERMLGLFFAPDATAAEVVARPDWWGPVLFFLIASVAAAPLGEKVTVFLMSQLGQPVPTGAGMMVGRAVGSLVSYLLLWPARGVVFYGVGLLFTPAITYRQSLVVAGYLSGIEALSAVTAAIVLAATGVVFSPGLAAGLTLGERILNSRGALLAELNLFTAWYLVASTLFLARLYRSSRLKAAVVTVILWALVLATKLSMLSWQIKSLPS